MALSRHKIPYWIPVFLWLAVIALESLFLSSNVTGGWLWTLFQKLHVPISAAAFERLHHVLRKVGHVTGYGILCLLLFRACYHSVLDSASKPSAPIRVRYQSAALAIGGTLLTAVLDEWRQSFDASRTSSITDVGLDVFGGVLFLGVALLVFKAWRVTRTESLRSASV